MKKNITFILLLLLIGCSAEDTSEYRTAVKVQYYGDKSRSAWESNSPRPLVNHIFYPTFATRKDEMILANAFDAGTVTWKADPAVKGKKPLIIMSHGTGGTALQMIWIAKALVKQGYIVVGLNHHGNTAIEDQKYPQGYKLIWERAKDISVVLENLKNDPNWQGHIDQSRIGIIGFSLGGHTAISAIGGISNSALLETFCNSDKKDFTCDAQFEFADINSEYDLIKGHPQVINSIKRQYDNYKIPAIRAAFVIAPAVMQIFEPQSLKNINIPVSINIGTIDEVAPATYNAKYLTQHIPVTQYYEILNAGHYTFLSTCTGNGKKTKKKLCTDHSSIDRAKTHNDIAQRAVMFFNKSLNFKPQNAPLLRQ